MFRMLFPVVSRLTTGNISGCKSVLTTSRLLQQINGPNTNHNSMLGTLCSPLIKQRTPLLSVQHLNVPTTVPQVRTVIKFSMKKGKRKTVKAVVKRFFRLHWGGWIRTYAGRYKRLWKKSGKQRNRYKNHIFCNTTQSYLLDKMVTKFWRTPKHYVDDPYAPYHSREEFPITRRKPV